MELVHLVDNGKRQAIDPQSIEYLRGQANYSWIYFVNNSRPLLYSRGLAVLHQRLPTFLRIDKGILVNPYHVVAHLIRHDKPSFVYLSGDRSLSVSRRQKKFVRNQLSQLSH